MRDYIKRNLVLCVIGVASAAWACGDGDDDGNGTGGTGGTAGKGGSSGSAGKGGTGGTAGKGGSSGSAGKGGSSGSAGKGGTSGSAGSPEGGMAGDETAGGSGGEQGGSGGTDAGGAGSGGEDAGGTGGVSGAGDGGTDPGSSGAGGGPAEPTVAELCTTICTRVAGFASTTTCAAAENCVATCEEQVGEFGATNDLYVDMLGCLVNNLDASEDYMCADPTTLGNLWSVVIAESGPANACDEATCAWTCDPAAYGADPTLVYYGCGCL